MTPQFEALRAVYTFLQDEGFECWGFAPDGREVNGGGAGSFSVATPQPDVGVRVRFEVSLFGVGLVLAQYASVGSDLGWGKIWRFDLGDPACFDQLLLAIGEGIL